MEKNLSIVQVDTRHHRKIAQENWGLTNEQMEGMHVHHRIHRAQGGTNDPSNLYVCSPSYHAHVWHAEDGCGSLIQYASVDGRDLEKRQEDYSRIGTNTYLNKQGLFGRDEQKIKEDARMGGRVSGKLPWWHHPNGKTCRSREKPGPEWIKGRGPTAAAAMLKCVSIRYKCLVTGKISTAPNLTRYQKKRGIDPSLRVKVTIDEVIN